MTLIFILAPLLRAHSFVTFYTVRLIRKPFMMLPICIIHYIFGMMLFERLFKFDLFAYNPTWVTSILHWLNQYVSMPVITRFSFWTFILGGLVFSLVVALIAYPIARRVFTKRVEQIREADEKKKQAQPDIPPAPKHPVPFIRYEIPPKH